MTQAEKHELINKFKTWKDAVQDFENHPRVSVKEQAAQETLSDKAFWDLVDSSSAYLGYDTFPVISDLSSDASEQEFIQALS